MGNNEFKLYVAPISLCENKDPSEKVKLVVLFDVSIFASFSPSHFPSCIPLRACFFVSFLVVTHFIGEEFEISSTIVGNLG
jgi:hypothetical protein